MAFFKNNLSVDKIFDSDKFRNFLCSIYGNVFGLQLHKKLIKYFTKIYDGKNLSVEFHEFIEML